MVLLIVVHACSRSVQQDSLLWTRIALLQPLLLLSLLEDLLLPHLRPHLLQAIFQAPYCDRYRPCGNGSHCCTHVRSYWHRCCPDELECCYWMEPKCCQHKNNTLGEEVLTILTEEEVAAVTDQ